MPSDDSANFLPSVPIERQRPQRSRAVLGALSLLLLVAVVLALWFLVFDDDDTDPGASDDRSVATGPTPLPIPTSTPSPEAARSVVDDTQSEDGTTGSQVPTPLATTLPTPVPDGFEACGSDRAPSSTGTYIVDTTTTPLNQRSEPSVASEAAGAFDPGTTGLIFTGECLVNLGDGYVWWQINNGTADVWVASEFVSPG